MGNHIKLIAKKLYNKTDLYERANEIFEKKGNLWMLKKHWSPLAVITDDFKKHMPMTGASEMVMYRSKLDQVMRTVPDAVLIPDDKLLPGELSAAEFCIGEYKVRLSEKAYHRSDKSFPAENKTPVLEKAITDRIKKSNGFLDFDMRENYMITTAVSANTKKHASEEMYPVCETVQAKGFRWWEEITEIVTAKRKPFSKHDHLFVSITWYGMDNTTETWYDLNRKGEVRSFTRNTVPF